MLYRCCLDLFSSQAKSRGRGNRRYWGDFDSLGPASTLPAQSNGVTTPSETPVSDDVLVATPAAESGDKLRIIAPPVSGSGTPTGSPAPPGAADDDRLLSYMAENAQLKQRTAEIEQSLNHMEKQLTTMQKLLAALTDVHQHSTSPPAAPKPELESPMQSTPPTPPRVKPRELAKAPILNPVIQPLDSIGRQQENWWLALASALLGGLLILATIIGLLKWGTSLKDNG